jgi:tetratricopeptide (TPR) repeat protein
MAPLATTKSAPTARRALGYFALLTAVALLAWVGARFWERQLHEPARRHYRLAQSLYQAGKIEEALDEWQEAIREEPGWSEPYIRQWEALLAVGQPEAAIQVLRLAEQKSPRGRHLTCRIAQTYLDIEDPMGAAQWAAVAIQKEPGCASAHVLYARTHQANFGEVVGHLRQAQKLSPRDPTITVRLAKVQAEAGDLRDAETTLRSAGADALAGADAQFTLGMVLARRSRDIASLREAEKYLLEAIRLAPERHEAYGELGMLYERHRQWAKARDYFERARHLNPYSPAVLHHLGTVYRQLGDPRAQQVLRDLSDLQARTKRWRALRQKLTKHPDDLTLALDTAEAALSLGAEVSARSIADSVLQQDPQNARAKRLLVRLQQNEVSGTGP